jgi:hypothetical protein
MHMTYSTEHDRRQMYPDQRHLWSPTDVFREAIDVLTEYAASGDRLMASGVALQTRDYFKLGRLAEQIISVRDARNESNQVPAHRSSDSDPVE